MGLEKNESNSLLSNISAGENSAYFDGWKAHVSNPFHLTNNRQGMIQLGVAENQLCIDMIQEWIWNHPEASICVLLKDFTP
ncbi:hypothetical protein K1719_019136 [Acacia pycnantha]|nr:hypothetical protein K1719_019136 [Acacia pycnantha]